MPAARTYEPIQTYTVTGSPLLGTTGVTFSSIPQTYTDLIVVQNIYTTSLPAIVCMRVGNGSIDTGSNYSYTNLSGGSGSASSGRGANISLWISVLAHTGSGGGMYRSQIMNYSNTTTNKTTLARYDNRAYGATETLAQLWRNTAAINTVQCFLDRAEYYGVGSTFTLYGIKAA
jgi:hypothetical protein